MKIFTKAFLTVFILSYSNILFAQDYEVPKHYKFETTDDIKSYEKDILNTIEWLESTPVDSNRDKRKEANAFVLAWLTVTPSVKVTLEGYVTELTKKNPDLLMSFLGGWARYTLKNPNEIENSLSNNVKGIESLLKVYLSNLESGVKKDKKVEKLVKMSGQELQQWVKSNI